MAEQDKPNDPESMDKENINTSSSDAGSSENSTESSSEKRAFMMDYMLDEKIDDWGYDNSGYVNLMDLTSMPATRSETREYLLIIKTELKKYEKLIDETYQEIDKWRKRKELAQEKNADELLREADKQFKVAFAKQEKITTEYYSLKVQAGNLIKHFHTLPPDGSMSVDTDQLLADIEVMVGEGIGEMMLNEDFKKMEVEDKLKNLKDKMNKDKQN